MADILNVLSSGLGMVLFFLAQVAGLAITPFGLPGLWLQVAATVALVLGSGGEKMSWTWVGLFFVLGIVGELIEFISGQWGAKRFGGSNQAAWGALIGGLAGAIFGGVLIPIPIIGSLIASFMGTFAGAIAGEMRAQKTREPNLRVGFGALIGRAIGIGCKLFIGVLIAVLSLGVIVKILPLW